MRGRGGSERKGGERERGRGESERKGGGEREVVIILLEKRKF